MKLPTNAALQEEVGRLTVDLAAMTAKATECAAEMRRAIAERDMQIKEARAARDEQVTLRCDIARLSGMLDMLRECGMIPPKTEISNQIDGASYGAPRSPWRAGRDY